MKRTAWICTAALIAIGAAHAQQDAAQKELLNYVLTMDKIQKIGKATQQMQDVAKKHPELAQSGGDAKGLGDMAAKLQKIPEAAAILKNNGLAAREYVTGFFTLMQASTAVGLKKSGVLKTYDSDTLQVVSKTNLDFVDQHWDEIRKLSIFGNGQ